MNILLISYPQDNGEVFVAKVDLHTHTTSSDGTLTPSEIVLYAKNKGIQILGITDHDTFDGIEEAYETARSNNIELICGTEISADYSPVLHILAYFKYDKYKAFEGILKSLQKNRQERNPKILKKLNELGFDIKYEEVIAKSQGNIIGRPHFAQVMVDKGYVASTDEAFEKYLAEGRPAYVKKEKLSPQKTLKEIVSAGGVAVLAHPILLGMEDKKIEELIVVLKSYGLKGIEAYYTEHSDEYTSFLLNLAKRHDLIVTGGSDFHGSVKKSIEIGVGYGNLEVPLYCATDLIEHIEKT